MKSKGRVHRALHLAHHSHTARPLEHHHTSYRALFVVIATLGLSMFSIQYAVADDYAVTATVPDDTITTPAVITSPVDGTAVTDPVLTVSGTCEVALSGTVVTIVRSGVPLGSTPCQGDGTFSLSVTLVLGANPLIPLSANGNAVAGPDGATTSVTYQLPPAPEPPAPSGGGSNNVPTQPSEVIQITAQGSTVLSHDTGEAITIAFTVDNGTTPYTIETDWGDGQIDVIRHDASGKPVRLRHVYRVAGVYVIKVRAIDALGKKAVYEFTAVAQGALALNLISPQASVTGRGFWPTGVVVDATVTARVVWSTYGVLVIAMLTLWLVSPTHTLSLQPAASHSIRRKSGR